MLLQIAKKNATNSVNEYICKQLNTGEWGKNMIKFNLAGVLKQRGKSKYWLFKQINMGDKPMSYTNFNRYFQEDIYRINLEYLELFCFQLNCKPSDLLIIESD